VGTIQERIQRGADRLDKKFDPKEWPKKIIDESAKGMFDMGHPCRCSLGVLFGSFGVGEEILDMSIQDTIEHGFEIAEAGEPEDDPEHEPKYIELTQGWLDFCRGRLS